ncbi:MAG: YncE family protein [Acidobacteriaceae bacterium]
MKYPTRVKQSKRQYRPIRMSIPALHSFVLLCFFVVFPASLIAQTGGSTARVTLLNPNAILFSPSTGKVYSVDNAHNAVIVSNDTKGTTARVTVGSGPVSIAVDRASGKVYIANSGDGTVSVLDGATDAVLATIPVGANPYSIAANTVTHTIYLSRTYSDFLTAIDVPTNAITTYKIGAADLLSVNTRTNEVYAVGYEGGSVAVLDVQSGSIRKQSVGMHAWGLALDEASGTLYSGRTGDAEIAALKIATNTLTAIPTGAIPCALAIDAKRHEIYVVDYGDNSVTVLDSLSGRRLATIPVGSAPEAIAMDPKRHLVFIANTHGNTISIVDEITHQVIATLKTSANPYGLAFNPISGKLHVATLGERAFSILDLNTIRPPAQ